MFTGITGDVTAKAVYSHNGYTVTFKDWDDAVLKTEVVAAGADATAPTNPTRTGYTFTGWDTVFTGITGDIIVKATYSLNSYTVSFNSNNGSSVGPIEGNYGSKIIAPAIPLKAEHSFEGWYKDAIFNTVWKFDVDTIPENGITLYAKWTKRSSSNVGGSASAPVELTPQPPLNQISMQRVMENGEVSYRGNLTLENVQALLQQLTDEDESVVSVSFPTEAATVATTLGVQRATVAFLGEQKVDLFIQLGNSTIRIPQTSLNGFTEDLFFRIAPVKSDIHEEIQENAQQNEQVQAFVDSKMTVNLFGNPVTIETNMQNRPVTITLPIPTDATEAQIATLFVYIEHSDGTTEVKKGRIVEMEQGVKGFAFEVQHFSTFSLLYSTELEQEETAPETFAPYIQGYPDGTFKPNASVTRAQMATMLARFLTNGDIPTDEITFTDTGKSDAKDAIEFVKQAGLFNGTTQTTFDPSGTITRAQMAGVVARWVDAVCAQEDSKTYCQKADYGKTFTDVQNNHWAAQAIEKVSALGIMTGNSATTFNPSGSLTRAQAVKVLNQLFERPALENTIESIFRDVPASHWAIGEIEAAATEMIIKQ